MIAVFSGNDHRGVPGVEPHREQPGQALDHLAGVLYGTVSAITRTLWKR